MASDIQTLGVDLEVFPFTPDYYQGQEINVDAGYTSTQPHPFSAIKVLNDYADKRVMVSAAFQCHSKEIWLFDQLGGIRWKRFMQ